MSDERSRLPPDRLWQPTTAQWFAVVFGALMSPAITTLPMMPKALGGQRWKRRQVRDKRQQEAERKEKLP